VHHVRSRLSPYSRLLLCQRVAAGRPVAHVAAEMGVSRQTAHRWVTRFATEGVPGLTDRSSRPHQSPARTPAGVETRVLRARAARRGPVWIGGELGLPASTVGRVLRRHRVPLLRDLDRLTGIPVRTRSSDLRYERDHPGDLVHVDVKKLGRIRRRVGCSEEHFLSSAGRLRDLTGAWPHVPSQFCPPAPPGAASPPREGAAVTSPTVAHTPSVVARPGSRAGGPGRRPLGGRDARRERPRTVSPVHWAPPGRRNCRRRHESGRCPGRRRVGCGPARPDQQRSRRPPPRPARPGRCPECG